ncbi:MAG TPA: OmpA family protein [Kofleriaceae bacterium]|jgi:outer membrane protein OmpA-like peptidoglycan-associated protein|nr:OmpA family protein [Kofleriaceae bacterium]
MTTLQKALIACAVALSAPAAAQPRAKPTVSKDRVHVLNDRIVVDEGLLFDTNRARIRSAGRELIETIATMWLVHPEWKRMRIEGHTDDRGSTEFNQRLSERRAHFARRILLRHGYAPDRIEAVGLGASIPRVEADDEAEHHANRRVEFVFVRD